jgi:hypothetical protein
MPESNEHRSRNIEFPFRIGYIGTLSKVKGVEWLIRVEIKKDLVNPFFEFPLKKRNFTSTPITKI